MNKNSKIALIKDAFYYILKLFALISGFTALGIVLYYIIFISKGFYHGDCADTIMWAQAMVDGKTIMNPDFNYAALLPFGGQLLMAPFVAIFGYGMKAQIIGMVIFALLFTFAIVYFCRAAGLSYKWSSLTVAFVLLILCSSEKLREIFWCHIIYYSLGAFFLLLGLGLVLNLLKQEKFSIKLYVILFIWTTLCSINGSQSFTLYTIPVVGALIAERFFDTGTPFFSRKNARHGLIVINLVSSIAIGLILAKFINHGITSGYQEGYSEFDQSGDWVNNILKIIPAILELCGVNPGNELVLFSPKGLLVLLRIICVAIVMITPFVMFPLYRKFKEKSYKITLLAHLILSVLLLLGWIFGKLNAANWRLSPLIVTSSILTIMFIRWIYKEKAIARISAILIIPVSIMLLLCTLDVYHTSTIKQTESNKRLVAVGKYLEQEGLEYGYATFWNSNSIPLLTDSKVKLVCIGQSGGDLYPRMYQTNINWFKDNSYSEYFLLLSTSEFYSYSISSSYEEPMEIKFFEDYAILIYDYNIMEIK